MSVNASTTTYSHLGNKSVLAVGDLLQLNFHRFKVHSHLQKLGIAPPSPTFCTFRWLWTQERQYPPSVASPAAVLQPC